MVKEIQKLQKYSANDDTRLHYGDQKQLAAYFITCDKILKKRNGNYVISTMTNCRRLPWRKDTHRVPARAVTVTAATVSRGGREGADGGMT